MRLDVYLAEKGLCKSRTAARELIKSGGVSVNGAVCDKPSAVTGEGDTVEITGEQPRYVGRGGLKLEPVFTSFGTDISGAVCVDIGASTGGFTDCMLRFGAGLVFAVDVGTGQLDPKLRSDSRVVSLEHTDIRGFSFERLPDEYRARLPEGFSGADFIGADVSFISLKLILPSVFGLLRSGGSAAVLIKPQFEAGRAALNKKGIVTDPKIRERVKEEAVDFARGCGFEINRVADSPIKGGDGNAEYILLIKKP